MKQDPEHIVMKLASTVLAAWAFVASPALAATPAGERALCAEEAPAVVAAVNQACERLGTSNLVPNRKSVLSLARSLAASSDAPIS